MLPFHPVPICLRLLDGVASSSIQVPPVLPIFSTLPAVMDPAVLNIEMLVKGTILFLLIIIFCFSNRGGLAFPWCERIG